MLMKEIPTLCDHITVNYNPWEQWNWPW